MARRTKQQLIQIREASYKPPEIPENRCETCRHSHSRYGTDVWLGCWAIEIRGEPAVMVVHAYGICDLYEPKGAT